MEAEVPSQYLVPLWSAEGMQPSDMHVDGPDGRFAVSPDSCWADCRLAALKHERRES